MKSIRAKTCRLCAFCKHWYDPGNAAIRPKNPALGLWEYDEKAKSHCENFDYKPLRKSTQSCNDWVCKI